MPGPQESTPAELSVADLPDEPPELPAVSKHSPPGAYEPDRRRCPVAPMSPTACHVSLVELSLDDDERLSCRKHSDAHTAEDASTDTTEGADTPESGAVADSEVTGADGSGACAASVVEPTTPRRRGLDQLQKMEQQLSAAQHQLRLRDEEVARLTGVRNQIEAEMEELTASLFQEAHKMVLAANEKQAASEKALQEANMKIDVLSAEVSALKALVITSTPSQPNPHLHPQLQSNGIKIFKKGHHRSPSNQELTRPDASPPSSPARSPPARAAPVPSQAAANADQHLSAPEHIEEVDPRLLAEVSAWREQPSLELTSPFVAAVYREDVEPCLRFATEELTRRVTAGVLANSVCIEEVSQAVRAPGFPSSDDCRRCALLHVHRSCRYRMKLPDQPHWMDISQLCRNRITAVCDFLNYLRYVQLGLVKGSLIDVYRELMRLRRNMALARLGFTR